MLYIPGCVAAICHSIVLLGGGFFNSNIHESGLGYSDRGDPLRNNDDMNTLVALVALHFLPTFTMLCFGFSWLCCAYENEAGAYCMVAAPLVYSVFLAMWIYSNACRGRNGLRSFKRKGRSEIEVERYERGHARSSQEPSERAMYKNQLKEQRRIKRALDGSLFGNDEAYYNIVGSPARSARFRDEQIDGSVLEHSPYLKERFQREAQEDAAHQQMMLLRQLNAERQKRFNKAFEEYQSRLQHGMEHGPFIFEGEIIPVDEEERIRLEAIQAAGDVAVYE